MCLKMTLIQLNLEINIVYNQLRSRQTTLYEALFVHQDHIR